MFAKIGSNGLASKFQKIAVFVLALVVLFSALPAGKAYAWSYSGTIGRVGNATLPVIRIQDLNINGYVTRFTLTADTGPTISRVAGVPGVQKVGLSYGYQVWNGTSWQTVWHPVSYTQQISATQGYTTFAPPNTGPAISNGYFRFIWLILWSDAAGNILGYSLVYPTAQGDHVCDTYRICFTANGYFYHE